MSYDPTKDFREGATSLANLRKGQVASGRIRV